MTILIRMPNWLGDMLMAGFFVNAVQQQYPHASVSVIVKKELSGIAAYLPGIKEIHPFSKKEWPGLKGVFLFGRSLSIIKYDLFFCLPDSISSAVMGFAAGASQRIGFKKELRSLLLTKSYRKPTGLHRVEEYISLLTGFTGKPVPTITMHIPAHLQPITGRVIVNFNSEAISRRMTVEKGQELLAYLLEKSNASLVMIGAPNEAAHVSSILEGLTAYEHRITNMSGKTSLQGLVDLMATGSVMLTTDSGPAHLANAIGLPQVVLFGAGNEKNTAPYKGESSTVIRLGQLPCEPCVKNTCIYGLPKCLQLLDNALVVSKVIAALEK